MRIDAADMAVQQRNSSLYKYKVRVRMVTCNWTLWYKYSTHSIVLRILIIKCMLSCISIHECLMSSLANSQSISWEYVHVLESFQHDEL